MHFEIILNVIHITLLCKFIVKYLLKNCVIHVIFVKEMLRASKAFSPPLTGPML